MPGLGTLRTYRREWLTTDVLAGLVVFAVTVPASLAYAELAGLPRVAGLGAAMVAMFAYALFGSGRHLILGPDATVAMLVGASIAPLAAGDPQRAAALAAALAMVVGAICVAAALFRVGFVAELMPRSVVIGLVTGIGVLLISSQIGRLLGIPVRSDSFFPSLGEVWGRAREAHLPTAALGAACVVTLVALRRLRSPIPGPIVVAVLATLASVIADLAARGVAVVGEIPRGLPAPRLPLVDFADVRAILPIATSVALVACANTVLVARSIGTRHRYPIDPNQELLALGVANLSIGVTRGFVVGTSQSRTAVNEATGARSTLSGIVAALATLVFLLFLTPVLGPLPTVVLSAVVAVSGAGLIDLGEFRRMHHARPRSAYTAAVTALAVVSLGVLNGILTTVALSIVLVLGRLARPYEAVSRDRDSGVLVYRFAAPLIFLNAAHFSSRLRAIVESEPDPVRAVLVNAEAITDMDLTGAEALELSCEELAGHGITLAIASVDERLRGLFERIGLDRRIGTENLHTSVGEGIASLRARARLSIPAAARQEPAS